ncbi:DEKNAAC103329 [Brettanomyces naardenensis]|uniref:DEKNAAC103329 n=1 Tax=Brettanomyces naardenensis TaxID=13370 RepID=A0A448YNR3_BRENA|nr:DEKNAAC103329 [Brettanomyces naardenensis]
MSPIAIQGELTQKDPSLNHIPFTNVIRFYLNGKLQTVRNPDPEERLIDWIRNEADLRGTKEACSESGCNACSVCVASLSSTDPDHPDRPEIHYKAVNSCVTPLVLADGKHVITVEGIGSSKDPHPVQERIAKFHGSQCGFCTPGFVMALYTLLREKNGHVSVSDIDEALESNLCRCTGYMPIYDAAYSFAYDSDNYNREKVRKFRKKEGEGKDKEDLSGVYGGGTNGVCSLGTECCRYKKRNDDADGVADGKAACSSKTFEDTEIDMNAIFTPDGLSLKTYNPAKDIPFPLKLASVSKKPIFYGNDRRVWYRPVTKRQLLEIYRCYPNCKLVAGASEVQIEVKFKAADYKVNVYVNDVDELKGWHYEEGKGLTMGGNIPLIELEEVCDKLAEKLGPTGKGQVYHAIADQLKVFASKAVRNVATPAGNIVTASPIADLNPIFVACGAVVTAERLGNDSQIESTQINMRDEFFTGYRKHKLPPRSIVSSIFIPETQKGEFIHCYKQCKRKDDDISIVTACLRAQLDAEGKIVDSSLVYGGMAPITIDSKQTQEFIKGKSIYSTAFVEGACKALSERDFQLPYGVPGGMASYRRSLTLSFFYKFWQYMIFTADPGRLNLAAQRSLLDVDSLKELTREQKHGYRDLQTPRQESSDIIGKPIVHVNSLKQATGEAVYTDDLPPLHGELFGVQVMSSKAHAKVLSVDWDDALEVESVVGYVDINDLPDKESNMWGALPFGKEPFFADGEVFFVGQAIGVILAKSKERAYEASRKVRVEYEELPRIITVEDGVEQKSFFPDKRETVLGDWETAFKESKYVVENTARLSAQEHFYFEPQNCLVVPEEGGELKVYASTQNPNETQHYAAQVTGVPSNRVICRVKRLGGGFGGKETRSIQISSLAAVAANKFRKPVRIQLNRAEDMKTSGERHPFLVKYKASMDENLKFTGLDMVLYANAGWSMDLTRGVVDRSVLHATNAYYIPNVRVCGIPVKTNIASNTAYRSFGAQAGFYAIESVVTEFAEKLGIDPEEIRRRNYYKPNVGEIFHYKQEVGDDITIAKVVEENLKEVGYARMKKEVEEFNSHSKWIKRGIAHVPSVFGVSFGVLFLNQAGALVNIYEDGSCLISTGGVEIGQGISTVMRMIAADALGIPFDKVFLSETSTECVPNASSTAASSGSDLNGMALKDACEKLNRRLGPVKKVLDSEKGEGKWTWEQLITAAYLERVSLSATGFYKTPDIGYEWGDENPKPAFFYHTQGSAVSVVEVDTLTGEWTCLESHIKMDCGKPLNQAIIYGQIEGAFIQGMGYFTMEQSLWLSRTGGMATTGPGAYKIPGFRDIPQTFNVSMYKGSDFRHLRTIHSSKGVGEPPFFLGASVHFAIRDAISNARIQNGISEGGQGLLFRVPLTTERIRVDCGDELALKSRVEAKENEQEFFIEG